VGHGVYKLNAIQPDKELHLVRNPHWYGWTDGKHEGQFQPTDLRLALIPNADTSFLEFLAGKLDSTGIPSNQYIDFKDSSQMRVSKAMTTWKLGFTAERAALRTIEETTGYAEHGTNLQVLANAKFREGFSLSIDRDGATNYLIGYSPAFSLYSDQFYYIVGSELNQFVASPVFQEITLEYYGYQKGAGDTWTFGTQTFATRQAAFNSVRGQDPELAKTLMVEAWGEELARNASLGTGEKGVDPDKDILIVITVPTGALSSSWTNLETAMNDRLVTVLAGTVLAGKVKVKMAAARGGNYLNAYDDAQDGKIECLFSGIQGGALYPFEALGTYIDPADAAQLGGFTEYPMTYFADSQEGYGKLVTIDFNKYASYLTTEDLADLPNGGVVTKTLIEWFRSITDGEDTKYEPGVPFGEYTGKSNAFKTVICASMESGLKDLGYFAIFLQSGSRGLYSYKISYPTLVQHPLLGFGGLRHLIFEMDDKEWDDFLASRGGNLTEDYKQ